MRARRRSLPCTHISAVPVRTATAGETMAHVVSEWRKLRTQIFNDAKSVVIYGESLVLNEIVGMKFINEYTGEEFLSVGI